MPDRPAGELEYVTAVRVLEYYGPKEWVELTLGKGGVPMQGVREFPMGPNMGARIASGIVVWAKQATEPSEPARLVPVVPPPSQHGGN